MLGELLGDERSWGAAGHVAWVFSKRPTDDLTTDAMFQTCMATTPPVTMSGWPADVGEADGWADGPRDEDEILTDARTIAAVGAKWAAKKWRHFNDIRTKDEQARSARLSYIQTASSSLLPPLTS